MIRYPQLQKGAVIGVTAPSSGIGTELHSMLRLAFSRMEAKGYRVLSLNAGESITQYSSPHYQKEWDHDHPSPQTFIP